MTLPEGDLVWIQDEGAYGILVFSGEYASVVQTKLPNGDTIHELYENDEFEKLIEYEGEAFS